MPNTETQTAQEKVQTTTKILNFVCVFLGFQKGQQWPDKTLEAKMPKKKPRRKHISGRTPRYYLDHEASVLHGSGFPQIVYVLSTYILPKVHLVVFRQENSVTYRSAPPPIMIPSNLIPE